jgi:hypothetical protein
MMDDDFLIQYRKPPRREFAEALYQRISKENRIPFSLPLISVKHSLAWGVAIVCLVFTVVLAVSPDVRAQAGEIIKQIGRMTFQETPHFPEELLSGGKTENWEETTLDQARITHPDLKVPTWMPESFALQKVYVIPDNDLMLEWGNARGDKIQLVALRYGPRYTVKAGSDSMKQVQVNGQPAALVYGSWNTLTKQWMPSKYPVLHWQQDGFVYILVGGKVAASVDNLIRIAESLR